MKRLDKDFFNRDTLQVAKDLLGKILVIKLDNEKVHSRIVEVEAYAGLNDKASHTYNGKRTKRNEIMYDEAGKIYVYFIYGMYNMFNIVTNKYNKGEAVLIRAVQTLNCENIIANNRYGKDYIDLNNYQKLNITNGPGKLCKALNIDRKFNGKDLFSSQIYIADDNFKDFEIIESKRIGINYAEEAKDYLYRFYIKNNPMVSKVEK